MNAVRKSGLLLGLDIGGTKCTVVLAGADGRPIASRALPTSRDRDPYGTLARLLDAAAALLSGRDSEIGAVARIGISCGGPLDAEKGLVLSPPNLPGWDEFPIARLVAERFPEAVVFLENDANASALAEWKYGAGVGSRNMVFLTFGTGLGAGLILDGKLYAGTNGLAGEIGHWRMAEDGPEAYGKRGSFEGFCSGTGIARLAELRLGEFAASGGNSARDGAAASASRSSLRTAAAEGRLTAKDVAEAAGAGDELACRVVEESARTLGRGLALLVDLLNPEVIVIGSVYARNEALFKGLVAEEIRREALGLAASACRVVPAKLGEELPLYAPVAVALEAVGEAKPSSP